MSARSSFLIAAAVGLLCAGCATKQPAPEITRARTLIEQAERAGAQQYAASDLESARNNLRLANAAAEHGKDDEARSHANEAAADAELAQSRAANNTAEKAATEVRKSTETLEREAERQQSPGLPPATGPATPVPPTP